MAAKTITWADTASGDELDHSQINSIKAAVNDHAALLDEHAEQLGKKEAAGAAEEVLRQAKLYTDQKQLKLGTTGETAAAGNHAHTPDEVAALALLGLPLVAGALLAKPWALTQASSLTSGGLRLIPVYLPAGAVLTGAAVYLAASGQYTPANDSSFSLYSLSAGTLTRVATTGNQPNLFAGTAQSYVQRAFTAPYSAAPGLYYVGILFGAAAGAAVTPTLGAGANLNNAGMAVLPGGKLLPALFNQANAPASVSITSTSNSNNPLWAGLY